MLLPRARDPNRDKAFELYKSKKGNIDLVEIASQLNISSGTVRGWKSKDKWDDKLNGTLRKNMERSKQKKKQDNEKKEAVADEVKSVIENAELTDKQRLFCCLYIKCFNATKAYQKAYECSYQVAASIGYRMLENDGVKQEIHKLKQERLNREFLSESDIFQKYMDIAFADITDYVSFGREQVDVMGPFGPVKAKDEDGNERTLTKEVNTVRFRESKDVDGTLIAEVKQGRDGASIKLPDKMKALDWIAAHMDMATEKQRAEINVLKAKVNVDDVNIENDGFINALKGEVNEVWEE